ncbi:SIR2 family NAD-dependent protein deacylase [Pasteurella bettyae]|uniref:protein acetyllysine N-acetyltransferase n=1 Tax=Pasteurella bettyae CCUG 2042 TaxID=1095749 RepID=I3DFJ8_9PAST|nr:Sir2 family NAD-dependent protein deacetylase [Pasteurella bettyae]EIJ70491.1 transcriptional regulator, Sir2 family [Pasteurella bettyae CCUG 2042]SUB21088.1 NAD-dependent deacetylase [Pasteurella bettyae]
MKNDLNYAAELIRQADGILITAGAGMSVDSGLPDFRSVGGFWNAYPPLKKFNLQFMDIATPQAYQYRPELAKWFFAHRLNQYRQAEPHEGYAILQRWAAEKPHGYFVFTSNVDGHFRKAGFAESRIYECHGTLDRLQCVENCEDKSWWSYGYRPVTDDEQCIVTSEVPTCLHCGGLARQNVLMFNDWTYSEGYQLGKQALLDEWLHKTQCPVVIEIGAGKAIPTVRNFSERTAKQKKGGLIRINPIDAGVPKMHFLSLEMGGLEALRAIDKLLNK